MRAAELLAWYDRNRRILPWRALPGAVADPYRVWVSEIMLQQTSVTAVIPYYERFVTLFPDLATLAAAPVEAVMQAWAGLGYYSRARNLHACAQAVMAQGGAFPRDIAGLRALPGIGDYTAAAVAAIAFGVAAVPVDGNVQRVASRVFGVTEALPRAAKRLAAAASLLGEDKAARARPADFAQALFDLGASLCGKGAPACGDCPWRGGCAGFALGIAASLPVRAAKAARPVRYGAAFLARDAAGRVLLRRRAARGLLGGMEELPGTEWGAAPLSEAEALALAPLAADWRMAGEVRHVFTHFELVLTVYAAKVAVDACAGNWAGANALAAAALPSVMRKCLAVAGEG